MSIYKVVKGQGKDVVLLHGWSCNHRHVQPIMDELVKRYRVTCVDLPGSGDSDWNPNNQNIHDIANQLLEELPDSAIYVGWSFGGLVAISIAARHPKRVKRIVGIGTTPKFISDEDWPAVPQPGFQAVFKKENSKKGFKAFLAEYYDSEFKDLNPKPETYTKLIALLNEADKFDLDIWYKGVLICDKTDLREDFKSLNCPIDIIIGDHDDSVPVTSHECIKALNPLVNIHIIPGGHHMPFWTHPEKFNKVLAKVL